LEDLLQIRISDVSLGQIKDPIFAIIREINGKNKAPIVINKKPEEVEDIFAIIKDASEFVETII
jgi:hypothetical protein